MVGLAQTAAKKPVPWIIALISTLGGISAAGIQYKENSGLLETNTSLVEQMISQAKNMADNMTDSYEMGLAKGREECR